MTPYAKSGVAGSAVFLSWTNRPRVGFAGVGGTLLRVIGSLDFVGTEGAEDGLIESSGRVCFEVDARADDEV